MEKFYITTPIYYVNGKPHIGHTYTTIAADVLARYFRLQLGEQHVHFITGTDEHGSKIHEKAQELGKDTQLFTDEISDSFKDTWEKYQISYNTFIRTTNPEHRQFAKDFIVKLRDNDALYEDEYEGLYCVGCEKFVTEKELIEGKCPDHLKEPQVVKEKNWFFNLEKFLPQIKDLIENDTLKIQPEYAKKEVLGLIKQGVPNFSVSREREKVKWGIELPWDSNQLIYVWVDALSNYISTEQPRSFWPANMQIVGKDIVKFHALYWPAMLLANGYELPKELFVHGFFTVNGQKMSKTIGNVIDPNEMFDEFGADAAKYLILNQFPFGQDGDIQKDRFVEKFNAELANGLGNLLNRVVTLVEKNYDGVLPQGELMQDFADEVQKTWNQYHEFMTDSHRLDKCLDLVRNLVSKCDKLITDVELWKLVKEDRAQADTYFVTIGETLRHVSWLLHPFMHNTAEQIQSQLGILEVESQKNYDEAQKWGNYPENVSVQKGDVLFMRK